MAIMFCSSITLCSCGQFENKTPHQEIRSKTNQIDSSNTAIIQFSKKGNFPFDNSFMPTTLTKEDLNSIDSLLVVCVTEYNNSLDKNHKEWSIDLKKNNYRKQIIAVINKKGEKEVWLNCFCHINENSNWRTEILGVDDGGNCYFNFKLNLATKKFYELGVNGEA
jgi:hypothetical protein